MISKDDHERERREFWDACMSRSPMQLTSYNDLEWHAKYCAELARLKLAERDKMFPGPVDAENVRVDGLVFMSDTGVNR